MFHFMSVLSKVIAKKRKEKKIKSIVVTVTGLFLVFFNKFTLYIITCIISSADREKEGT